MNEKIYCAAEMYVMGGISLVELAEVIKLHTPSHSQIPVLDEIIKYINHYKACYEAAMYVGCEVLIDTPYDTFEAFVVKDDGEYILVDHNGESEKYHSSCVQCVLDRCDE